MASIELAQIIKKHFNTDVNFYKNDSINSDYFSNRVNNPYRQTIQMEIFLNNLNYFDKAKNIYDPACGTGSDIAYMAKHHKKNKFFASDINKNFIKAAKSRIDLPNLKFFTEDLYKASSSATYKKFDSLYLGSTLSWVDWWLDVFNTLITENVQQVAFDALAWDWDMESEVIHYRKGKNEDPLNFIKYNVLSINKLKDFFKNNSFKLSASTQFNIDIELKDKDKSKLGSYTIKTKNDKYLIFSAWQYLPRVFFYFSKI